MTFTAFFLYCTQMNLVLVCKKQEWTLKILIGRVPQTINNL